MNARQAAKAAAKRIEDLEHTAAQNAADIKAYNQCIQDMIAGESPCKYCEEMRLCECPNPEKQDHGCQQWWIRLDVTPEPVEEGLDDSKGIHGAGSEG